MLVGGGCVAAVTVAGVVLGDRVPPLDGWILRHWWATPGSAPSDVAAGISVAGTLLGLVAVLAGFAALWRARGAGTVARYAVVLVGCGATGLLQMVFQRPGPPVVEADWTYPSGHAAIMTAAAFTCVLMCRSSAQRTQVAVPAGLVVVAVSAGRLVLGEHYLIDVVAAVVVTVGVGLLLAAPLKLLPAYGTRRPIEG